jgi:hypothetical protein
MNNYYNQPNIIIMSASDSTSINDLPTNPTGGGSIGGNVSFSINEPDQVKQQQQQQPQMALDQTTINQIVSGLQQASSSGLTQLQSRDIPRNTEGLTQDEQIQPNFIPQTSNRDYIEEDEDNDDIIDNYNKKATSENKLDHLYDEMQTPLLISILYFLFQLPFFKRYLFKYIPALFSKDGNINLSGYTFTSALFGLIYYLLSKTMLQFNRF